jgi:hypothetical protein
MFVKERTKKFCIKVNGMHQLFISSATHISSISLHSLPCITRKMAFKLVIFFAAASMASAGIIADYPQQAYYQPQAAIIKQAAIVKQVVHEEPANYDFNYDVHDTHTGDIKQQHESAKNGAISGQYSLIDADGYRRIVDYTADDHHGFNANVRREPLEGHKIIKTVQPAIAVQKVIAQPAIAVQKYVAPAPQYYSAPAQQYSAPSYYHH